MKRRFLKWLPVIVFAILTVCQMTWKHFNNPDIYYLALAVLLLADYWDRFYLTAPGTLKSVYSFIVGLCLWNLVEEIFFDPEKYDPSEYWGLLIGLLFLTYQLWKKRASEKK